MANHDRITRKIELANKKMTLKMVDGVVVDADKGIQAMKDSTQLFTEGKFAELLAVLREDGYILVRQVLPQAHVQNARVSMLKHLATKGAVDKGNWASHDGAIADDFLKQPGWTVDAESGGFVDGRESDSAIEGWQKLGLEVKKLFDGERLKEFYNHLFGSQSVSCPDCTWLRVMPSGGQTIVHADYYYFRTSTDLFSRNSTRPAEAPSNVCGTCSLVVPANSRVACALCGKQFHKKCCQELFQGEYHCAACANSPFETFTCWIPLGHYTPLNGVLAVIPKSHTLQGYDTPANNKLGKPLVPGEYPAFSQRQNNHWHTTAVHPGDLILFNIKTIHAATKNCAPCYRLSCDTRVAASPFDPLAAPCVPSIYQKPPPKAPPSLWQCSWAGCGEPANSGRFCKTCAQPKGSRARTPPTRALRSNPQLALLPPQRAEDGGELKREEGEQQKPSSSPPHKRKLAKDHVSSPPKRQHDSE